MAGVVGFEPTHDGIKTRCLTAWLHPNILHKLQECHSEDDKPMCQDWSDSCQVKLSFLIANVSS